MHDKISGSETRTLRKHLENHPKKKVLKRLSVVVVVSLVGVFVLAALLLVAAQLQGQKTDVEATKRAQDILKNATNAAQIVTIKSGMGFSVDYDATVYSGYGFVSDTKETRPGWVSGDEFTDIAELKTKRNYTIVKVSPKSSDDTNKFAALPVELTVTTNFHKDYFTKRKVGANAGKPELELLLEAEKETLAKDTSTFTLVSATKMQIQGRDYYKLVAEDSYDTLGGVKKQRQYRYITVNDGSPYWLTIGIVNDETEKDVAQFEAIIRTVTFSPHDSGALVWSDSSPVVAVAQPRRGGAVLAATPSSVTDGTSHVEGSINSGDAIRLIAKNQLSTVRVGVLRCADVTYRSDNNLTFSMKNACSGGIGSGSIISSDGYVLTNGHVVYVSQSSLAQSYFSRVASADDWQRYVDFIINAGYVTKAQVQAYFDEYKKGKTEAGYQLIGVLSKVPEANITTSNDEVVVNVQTSDVPMRMYRPATGRWSWDKLAGNKVGKLVDYEVDTRALKFQADSTKTDVALVKIDGEYPTVRLSSLESFQIGGKITAIGYPAVVDDGINTKESRTVPTVSQGEVTAKGLDGGGHTMVRMTAVIAAGNSGGPAFDSDGKQVGINTYGGASCGATGKSNDCFGLGVARDAADIRPILSKANVTLKEGGTVSDLWNKGIDSFLAADYATASTAFRDLDKKYPNNYLVKQFLDASDGRDTASGTTQSSTPVDAKTIIGILLSVFGLITLLAVIVMVVVLLKHRHHDKYPGALPPQPQQ